MGPASSTDAARDMITCLSASVGEQVGSVYSKLWWDTGDTIAGWNVTSRIPTPFQKRPFVRHPKKLLVSRTFTQE
jgi:hypothetical protein